MAEGIESDAAAYLRSARCDVGQGFHLGRPVPAGEAEPERLACEDHTVFAVHLAS